MNLKILTIHRTIADLVQLYDAMISSYEETVQKLMNENTVLREEKQKLVSYIESMSQSDRQS